MEWNVNVIGYHFNSIKYSLTFLEKRSIIEPEPEFSYTYKKKKTMYLIITNIFSLVENLKFCFSAEAGIVLKF